MEIISGIVQLLHKWESVCLLPVAEQAGLAELPAQAVINVSAPTPELFFCLLLLTALSLRSL